MVYNVQLAVGRPAENNAGVVGTAPGAAAFACHRGIYRGKLYTVHARVVRFRVPARIPYVQTDRYASRYRDSFAVIWYITISRFTRVTREDKLTVCVCVCV